MISCQHQCPICGWQWDCLFPYYSECESLEEAFEQGWEGCQDECPFELLAELIFSQVSQLYPEKQGIREEES